MTPGQVPFIVLTTQQGTSTAGHNIVPVKAGSSATADFFTANDAVRLYATAGTGVVFEFSQVESTGPASCHVSISGHLEDVP